MQPQPFGLYTLIHRINVGGMAEVFKACYYDNGQPAFAAIKRILPHLAQDRSFIDMFITEAHTAGRLVHSNIAQIIEQGEEEGEYYISMEYISGRDLLYLRHHLKERGMFFPPALAAYVMMGVASALDYAHRLCDANGQHLEIIHRDVSPQNILISYDGEVKLIDFGIAKAKVRTQEHTRAGVLKGKFGYMAPEQVKGNPIDHRTDIFALGTVFYELLTNQRLFMGDSDIETLELVRQARIVPPSSINEWIPPQLDQIILLALQPDPQHRFQSAGDLAQALNFYIQQEAPMTHQSTLKTWMNQEFSTFIAHEKAQDSYLLDQMFQNIVDQQEDMDSTSLISADAIAMLDQYTASQLQAEQANELTDDITGPLEVEHAWEQQHFVNHQTDTVPPQHDTTPPEDLSYLDDQPATRQVSADLYEGLHQYAQAHTPYATPQELQNQQGPSLDEQELEDLLEESFDEDDSEVSRVEENLDDILAQSLSAGQRSPLATGSSIPFNPPSSQSTVKSPIPASPFASSAPSLHDEPTPPPVAQDINLVTPNVSLMKSQVQGSVSPLHSSVNASLVSSAQPPALFSEHEPTPIPNMRSPQFNRSLNKKTSSGSLLKVMLAVLVTGLIGGGAWFASQSLFASTPITIEVMPSQNTMMQVGSRPPVPVQKTQTVEISGSEKIVFRHPQLPLWERVIDPTQLPEQKLQVNLEAKAPMHQLKVMTKPAGAQVWIYGEMRGVTPYNSPVPLNLRGQVQVTLKLNGFPDTAKTLTKKSNGKPMVFFTRFR